MRTGGPRPDTPWFWRRKLWNYPAAPSSARTSDIGLTGCYIDTLNPVPQGAKIGLRITHGSGTFETLARVVDVSYGLGMGIVFANVDDGELAKLDR